MAKRVDISIAGALILLAGLIIYTSRSFPHSQGPDVGAGFFPAILSGILILLSLILIFSALSKVGHAPEKTEWKKAVLAMVFTFLYFLFVTYIGYVIATPLFLAGMMWYYQYRKKINLVFWSLFITGIMYFCFDSLLRVPLPMGLFFE
ncbi:tripartite tricarboxylate transporter TctB family protein [Neobacillus sp. PS2-9]|uniref:tripartite tricarboxylate transporter TctB family protein n=1 Tax=Neobacillus sp. PS2-9 TaxID=3070676 RepID=UPI0027DFE985|nr:tripartite tricarboxylate transporter TctB family protein [Neobacillus sp. PS2-9]WML56647.1 tripartite tricarboxylate transporter TctB family protein [Neobacillus sp. PS2-9]